MSGKRKPGINKIIRNYVKLLQDRVKELEAALREECPNHPALKRKKKKT